MPKTADVTEALFSVFTGAELQVIGLTLRHRVRELERQRNDHRLFAGTLNDPERQELYQGFARTADLEIQKLTAIIEKTPLW